jgi:hypothetical protein
VQHPKQRDDSVETVMPEGESFSIHSNRGQLRILERALRSIPTSPPPYSGPARGGLPGYDPAPGREVQHPFARPDSRDGQQLVCESARIEFAQTIV